MGSIGPSVADSNDADCGAASDIRRGGLIESIWLKSPFTVVLVTHDVDEAIALADHVILIEDGRIGADWNVSLARPRNRGSPGFARLTEKVLEHVLGS